MLSESSTNPLLFRVSVLIFIKNQAGKFLLLKRNKSPNKGCWSPAGGKLEMDQGESPFDCAIREIYEEVNLTVFAQDLHLFAMVSEKNYENKNHCLLFLFECQKPIDYFPEPISEGHFGFFSRKSINNLILPSSDRKILWPLYDQHHKDFVVLKADCHPDGQMEFVLEASHSVSKSELPYNALK